MENRVLGSMRQGGVLKEMQEGSCSEMLGPRGLGPVQAHLSLDKASSIQTTFLCFPQGWMVDLFICFSGDKVRFPKDQGRYHTSVPDSRLPLPSSRCFYGNTNNLPGRRIRPLGS